MGLHDRDYYREHVQRQEFRSSSSVRPLRSQGAGRAWRMPAWVIWLGLLVVAAVAAKAWQEWKRTVPFPATGQVQWFTDPAHWPTAPLTLQAPAAGAVNFAVQFDDWESHAPLALVPVRAGETATVHMPLGRYRMTIHKGLAWQGSSRLFGFSGDSRESVHPVEPYRTGNTIMGQRIQLETLGGNMETRPANRH